MPFFSLEKEPTETCSKCVDVESADLIPEDEQYKKLRKDCDCTDGRREMTYPFYLNVYEITQHYGGREEGGWWFDYHKLLETFLVHDKQDKDVMLQRISKFHNDPDDRHLRRGRTSAAGGHDIVVVADNRIGHDINGYSKWE